MVAPINYMEYLPQVDLAQKFGQGFQIGNAIQNAPLERERYQLQTQAMQAEMQQREALQLKKLQYDSDLKAYWDNPTVQGAARLSTQYPEHAQAIKQAYDMQDEKAKEFELRASVPIYTALLNGKNDIALDLIDRQIEATRNSNQDTSGLEAYKSMIESDPKGAIAFGGTYLSTIQGADKFAKTFGDLQVAQSIGQPKPKTYEQGSGPLAGYVFDPNSGTYSQQVDVPESALGSRVQAPAKLQEWDKYQELKQTDPEAAKEFGQSAGFLGKDGKLSAFMEKNLSAATDDALKSRSNVQAYQSFAEELEKKKFSGGVFGGKWSEAAKDFFGTQDAVTDLRKRYTMIRSTGAIKLLPQGSASNQDVLFAMQGFPTDNAPSEQIASFVRGMAKIEENNAKYQEFKANYITENNSEKGLLNAWKSSPEFTGDNGSKPPASGRGASGSFGTPATAKPSGSPMKPAGIPQAEWDQFIAETGGR